MSIFEKLNDDTDLFILKINAFRPEQLTEEYKELLQNYTTPSRSYITSSARGVLIDDVEIDTLRYIITECFRCNEEQKYQAIIVTIHKIFEKYQDLDLVQTAKDELSTYLSKGTSNDNDDMSFLDIGDHTDNFFYIIEISIGANKILKYGKTNSLPRLRFAKIKNDIKENYRKFHISIKPLVLAYYNDIAEFEDMVKVSLSEHNIGSSNYKFAGSSETFSLKDKDKVLDILNISAGNLSNTDKLEILYDEMS